MCDKALYRYRARCPSSTGLWKKKSISEIRSEISDLRKGALTRETLSDIGDHQSDLGYRFSSLHIQLLMKHRPAPSPISIFHRTPRRDVPQPRAGTPDVVGKTWKQTRHILSMKVTNPFHLLTDHGRARLLEQPRHFEEPGRSFCRRSSMPLSPKRWPFPSPFPETDRIESSSNGGACWR